jgi:hypothetical protein
MILIQAGFGNPLTNWIMSCVESTYFVVLINGEATDFSEVEEDYERGALCPLCCLSLLWRF